MIEIENGERDPVLVEAMDHIKGYLKERDIGGVISLQSITHGEIGVEIPMWAALSIDFQTGQIRIHAGKDQDLQDSTAGFIFANRDCLENYYSLFSFIADRFEEAVEGKGGSINHTPFKDFKTRN